MTSLDAAQLAERIKFHMLETRTSTALVVRVFEVWTHIEDLCRALRRDPPGLDAARLHLMTRTAVRAIPLGMLLVGIDSGPHTVRLVLTGSGGGVWNQPLQLGAEAGESSVTIIADALEFCRLAAQRIRLPTSTSKSTGRQTSPSRYSAAHQSSRRERVGLPHSLSSAGGGASATRCSTWTARVIAT